MRPRSSSRHFGLLLAIAAIGCSSAAGSCGQPIPGGFAGTKTKDVALARVSSDGFGFVNTNWKSLLKSALGSRAYDVPGKPDQLELRLEMGCMDMGDPGGPIDGNHFFACDSGRGGPGTVGYMDGKCDANDTAPCTISVFFEQVKVTAASPSNVTLRVVMRLATSDIYVDSQDDTSFCAYMRRHGCFATFQSQPGWESCSARSNEVITGTLKLTLDPTWGDVLAFDLDPAATINDLEADCDLKIEGIDRKLPDGSYENMCEWACNSVDGVGFIKNFLVNSVVKPKAEAMVKDIVAQQRCMPCDALAPNCPTGSTCKCLTPGCAADQRVCMGTATNKCVPRLLGVEQRLPVGAMLANFGAHPETNLDVYAAAGGSAPVADGSLKLAMMGGAQATNVSACVPKATAPTATAATLPDLATAGPTGHHVGIALSEFLLNSAGYEAHQSGALCLSLGADTVAPLNTKLFETFLPSLGALTGPNGAPMTVVMRPMNPPHFAVGKGTYDPTTQKPTEPLLTLEMKDVRLDAYALLEERPVRLFTLAVDVKLPMSLIAEGCPMTLLPVLGDLSEMVTMKRDVATNSELLAEDPRALEEIIPGVMALVEPALATALRPLALPDIQGFRLHIKELKGLSQIGESAEYAYLGAFANLGLPGSCPQVTPPETTARLAPTAAPTGANGQALTTASAGSLPAVTLDASASWSGAGRTAQYAWRVNDGFWSEWQDTGRLTIRHPAFLVQGRHRIDVRARAAGDAISADPTPARVEYVVDHEAPAVTLAVEADHLVATARDGITPATVLQGSWRLGQGGWTAFGPLSSLDLDDAQDAGSVELQVRDEAGNIGSAKWIAPAGGLSNEAQAAGCSSAGGGLAGLAGLMALLPMLRRRKGTAPRA